MTRSEIFAFLRRNAGPFLVEVGVNFALPYLVYDYAHRQGFSDVQALIVSSGPPIVWSVIELIWRRRLDAVSLLVLAGIALSVLAVVGGGSVRFLQLREKLVTALIGLAFLGSAAINRPLIYQLARASARRRSVAEGESLEALRDNRYFKRSMMVMTLVWGTALVLEAGVGAALTFVLSVRDYILVGHVLGYGTMGCLALWTVFYVRGQRRKGEARRAAAKADAPTDLDGTPLAP